MTALSLRRTLVALSITVDSGSRACATYRKYWTWGARECYGSDYGSDYGPPHCRPSLPARFCAVSRPQTVDLMQRVSTKSGCCCSRMPPPKKMPKDTEMCGPSCELKRCTVLARSCLLPHRPRLSSFIVPPLFLVCLSLPPSIDSDPPPSPSPTTIASRSSLSSKVRSRTAQWTTWLRPSSVSQ